MLIENLGKALFWEILKRHQNLDIQEQFANVEMCHSYFLTWNCKNIINEPYMYLIRYVRYN